MKTIHTSTDNKGHQVIRRVPGVDAGSKSNASNSNADNSNVRNCVTTTRRRVLLA